MPDWILLPPIVFPLLAALAYTLAAARMPARVRAWLPFVLLALELVLILVTGAPGSHTVLISSWDPASYSLALQIDGATLLLLVTMLVPMIGLWLVAPPRSPLAPLPICVVTASFLLAAAANLETACFAWALLDVAIFAWRLAGGIEKATAVRTLATSLLAGLILFVGSVLVGPNALASGSILVGLALWARLALFPFHWTLPNHGDETFDLWISRGLPMLAATSLWLHWPTSLDWPVGLIGVLFVAANFTAALWIWREEQPTRAANVAAMQALTFVPLALAFGGDAGLALGLWLGLSAVMAIALFEAAQRWRAENRNRYPRLFWCGGVVSLAALPLTPAFLARLGVYVILAESGQWLLLVVASAATLVVLAALWDTGFSLHAPESRESTRAELAGLILFVLALAALSLAPLPIAHALGGSLGDSAERVIDRVIRTDDLAGVLLSVALAVLPFLLSFALRRAARWLDLRPAAWLTNLDALLDLEWLERIVTAIGYQIGALARSAATIEEENPTVWILLAGLWVAIFISILH